MYAQDATSLWYFYLLFLVLLIPLQVFLDSFAMYLVDVLFSYNLLDYLRFCEYRISICKEDWLSTNAQLDVSLEKTYRSLDALFFSDQFYYCVASNSWGGILAVVGFQVITLNGYNLFQDPWTVLFLVIMFMAGRIGRAICKLISNVFKVWRKKKVVDSKQFATKINLENYMMKEWNMYEHDSVRHSLLTTRKDWIINNLPQFVSKEQFREDNGFLIRVQKRLEDIIRKEEIEVVRKNLIEKNKYVPKTLDIDDNAQNNAIVFSTKPQFIKLVVMLQHWHNLGREAVYYREMIKDIKDRYLEQHCQVCNSDDDLSVGYFDSGYRRLISVRPYRQVQSQARRPDTEKRRLD